MKSEGHTQSPKFVVEARRAATEWKRRTSVLDEADRVDAPYRGRGAAYPFCLPAAAASKNLLPDAREIVLERFAAGGIKWHHELAGGPSNHLLSSQVQCVNCLAPFVGRPHALAEIFAQMLPIGEVVPFGAATANGFDSSDCVVFEWIGLRDYLGERTTGRASRGSHTTSADAAIRYVNYDGDVEVALIEWKYTERYLGQELDGDDAYMVTRKDRYRELWQDPDGPLRTDLIPYDDLFVDPFYQLMRLQMLASEMEKDPEVGASVVRVIIVAPMRNLELAQSFNRESQHELGADVWRAWAVMQQRSNRYNVLDSATLVGPEAPTSAEFTDRYGHLAQES